MDPFVREHLAPWGPMLDRAQRLLVGFSGGVDSTVLLHALVAFRGPGAITAIHINHGLSPFSDRWQDHCRQQAVALGVGFYSEQVSVIPDGQGVEQAARHQRYRVFEQRMEAEDLLLLAHQGDDQAETVLYRMLRGSGPKGLAAMPVQRQLGKGRLLRPLLACSRDQVEDYARRHQLQWIDDESNQLQHFDRNYLRQSVMPAIAARWPDYRQRLARTAAQQCSAQQVLEEVAAEDLSELGETPCRAGWQLSLAGFMSLSPARQANLLRHWIAAASLPVPGHRVIDEILRSLQAGQNASPCVNWPGGELRRFRDSLYLCQPLPLFDHRQVVLWRGEAVIDLPGGGYLITTASTGRGLRFDPGAQWQIRFRQGGERCHPLGRNHSSTLKHILQECRLEPWLRGRVPLLYCDDELAAVGDLLVCKGFECPDNQLGLTLEWRPGGEFSLSH